jgi:hypothetical protein
MLLEVFLGVLASLADAVLLVGVPGAAFLHEPPLAGEVQEVPFTRDPLTIQHVELRAGRI